VSETPACIFCGRSDSVKPVGGNKGICNACAESLTGTLINTKRGKAESGHIIFGIGDEIREHEKKAGHIEIGSGSTGTPAATADDPMAKLTKLKNMFDAGLITQEEYDKKKAEILSSL